LPEFAAKLAFDRYIVKACLHEKSIGAKKASMFALWGKAQGPDEKPSAAYEEVDDFSFFFKLIFTVTHNKQV
jgi:hypothetical protein